MMMCKIGKTIYHIIGAFTGMSVRHPLEKKWKSILKNKPNQNTIDGWLQSKVFWREESRDYCSRQKGRVNNRNQRKMG